MKIMKTAKLQQHGKGWKLVGEKTLIVPGNFGLTDDMNNQEVEFDNTGGPVKCIRYNGKDYTKQENPQQDRAKYQNYQDQTRSGGRQGGYQQRQSYRGGQVGGGQRQDPARAPYNFVPLNKDIVGGGELPNHDSFEHLSGYIDLEVKALLPLFIKGHNDEFFRANEKPCIPGSSMRGLTRHMVEIVSYSALSLFEDKVFYRRSTLTADGSNVFAGFMQYKNGEYSIYPGKVHQINSSNIRDAHDYRFGEHDCTFSTGKFGHPNTAKPKIWNIRIGDEINNIKVPPNIIQSYQSDDTRSEAVVDLVKSLRKGLIVNMLGENINGRRVQIPSNLGIPVFYRLLEPGGPIISIGHAKYHRMPYAHSVADHIHQEKKTSQYDFATSIFGTTDCAGKVYFEDLSLIHKAEFELKESKYPKILSSPKPTTYQHYLEQPKGASYSMQNKWSDSDKPIRGFKNYWHRKTSSNPQDQNTWIEVNTEITKSHHAPINPISTGSTFVGKIRFDNLTKQELGALLFALDLPKGCGHKLGLGKPLGLGSIRVTSYLNLIQRTARYASVFEINGNWADYVNRQIILTPYKDKFAQHIGQQTQQQQISDAESFWEKDSRMKELKHILTIEQVSGKVAWGNKTRYMEIERYANGRKVNEYKHRPILPNPSEVIKPNTYQND